MRIRILHIPRSACIDGIRLDQFVAGHYYDVSSTLGALLLCEGWAEPVENISAPMINPPREFDANRTESTRGNLTRDTHPPYVSWTPGIAFERRRWPRSR
jgi:hypothetical protein